MFPEFWICFSTVHATKKVLKAYSAISYLTLWESSFLLLWAAPDEGAPIQPSPLLVHVVAVVSPGPDVSSCRGSLSQLILQDAQQFLVLVCIPRMFREEGHGLCGLSWQECCRLGSPPELWGADYTGFAVHGLCVVPPFSFHAAKLKIQARHLRSCIRNYVCRVSTLIAKKGCFQGLKC